MERDEQFTRFAVEAYPRLVRLAYVMSGDSDRAKDLTQETLTRVYVAWPRIHNLNQPFGYARATMINLNRDWGRRRSTRSEISVADIPEQHAPPAGVEITNTQALRDTVRALDSRERTAIVLRYYEDLTEQESAELMGCSVAAIKSLTHRAMTKLRLAYATADLPQE